MFDLSQLSHGYTTPSTTSPGILGKRRHYSNKTIGVLFPHKEGARWMMHPWNRHEKTIFIYTISGDISDNIIFTILATVNIHISVIIIT